jgi:hypothetical protein
MQGDEDDFGRALESQMRIIKGSGGGASAYGPSALIQKVERVTSRSLLYYMPTSYEYLRIEVATPQLVGAAVRALGEGDDYAHTYEATESKPSKYVSPPDIASPLRSFIHTWFPRYNVV